MERNSGAEASGSLCLRPGFQEADELEEGAAGSAGWVRSVPRGTHWDLPGRGEGDQTAGIRSNQMVDFYFSKDFKSQEPGTTREGGAFNPISRRYKYML